MRVLIIDDSKAIFLMVQEMLVAGGHEAFWAEDGAQAIELLKKEKFDILLLDWNMPVMDGPTFLAENKKGVFNTAPIMMMTTENKPEKIKKALELGAVEYMMKPFTSDILFNKIELVMD